MENDLLALHWTNGYVGGWMCLRETAGRAVGDVGNWSDVTEDATEEIVLAESPCTPAE